MTTITIPKKEYQAIIQRQYLIEKELAFFKKSFFEFDDINIKPIAVRRWERISRDMDKGKGRSFISAKKMKEWLKNL